MDPPIYLFVEDGEPWDCSRLFLSLDAALHYATKRALHYLSRGYAGAGADFHIETFRPKPEDPGHLVPTYECYRLRTLEKEEASALQAAHDMGGRLLDFFEHIRN